MVVVTAAAVPSARKCTSMQFRVWFDASEVFFVDWQQETSRTGGEGGQSYDWWWQGEIEVEGVDAERQIRMGENGRRVGVISLSLPLFPSCGHWPDMKG